MPVVTVTASMPAELAEALHANARRADRSFSAEMRVAIRAHLGIDPHLDDEGSAGRRTPLTTGHGGGRYAQE